MIRMLSHPSKRKRLKAAALLKKTGETETFSSPDESEKINLAIHTDYSFSPYSPSLAAYMACKNGIYALDGNEAVKKVDGKVFSTYVIDENSAVLALSRDTDYFYVLFTQGNSYKMYSYTAGEEN